MSLDIEKKATPSEDNKNENKTQIDVTKFINSTNMNQVPSVEKLDNHDEILKQNLEDLIQKLDMNELRADVSTKNRKESVSLKDETWNVYCKLRSLYSLENDKLQWLAGVLYLTYEKMLHLNKLKHIWEQQSILNKNRLTQSHKMTRSSSNLGLKRKMTSDKLTANYETVESNESYLEKTSTDQDHSDSHRFPYFPFQLMLSSIQTKDLKEFFSFKLKFLIQALNVDDDLLVRFNRLQSHLNITCILYSKYRVVFDDLFTKKPHQDMDHLDLAHRIGWLLFISIKCKYPHLRNDLINSYHLLICSVSYSYVSYFVEANSETKSEQQNEKANKEEKHRQVMQTIDYICAKYEQNESDTNSSIQVKTVYEYHFKTHLEKLESLLFNSFCHSKQTNHQEFKHKLNMIYEKLNSSYELFLQKRTSTSQNESKSNCCLNELGYSLEIDERLYLHSSNSIKNEINPDEIDSSKYLLILPECLRTFLTNNQEIKEPSLDKFDIKPFASKLKSALCERFVHNENSKEMDPINQFIEHLNDFYSKMIDVLLLNEQVSLYSLTEESQTQFHALSNELVKNQTAFHKALYVCCFEIMYTFSSVRNCSQSVSFRKFLSNFQPNEVQSQQEDVSIKIKVKREFPWSMKLFELDAFDLFKFIETFVKCTTNSTHSLNGLNETKTNSKSANNSVEQNNQPNIVKRDNYDLILLDKQCVQHLNRIETELLESLVWHESSNIWNCLNSLELNESYEINEQAPNERITQLNMAFPLYDEVINNTFNASSTSYTNEEIILNLTPNPIASSQSQSIFSSPIKQPTITRVVGADSKNVITTTTQSNSASHQPNKVTLVTVNKLTDRPSSRLVNMSNSLCFFFRKFYNLANLRMRELIDKLDLINMVIHSILSNNEPTILSSSLNINSTQVQLTPISSAFNEQQQTLIRSIWNVFEFAMSQKELIKNRHLDQLLMCCIYVTCRLCSLNIQFQDIIKSYRIKYGLFNMNNSTSRSSVYRSVLLDSNSLKARGTIIDFYNQVFIKNVQKYAATLFNKFDVKLTPLNMTANIICPSPVPRTPNTLSYTLFSPRKISESIFISPGKIFNHQNSTSSTHYVQPLSNRNKLTFTFNDLNPAKSIDSINEMIKKNENKMRTSNKRLFSEISSSYNSIPTSSLLTTSQTNPSLLSTKSNSQTPTPASTSSIVTNVKQNLTTISLNSWNQTQEDGEKKIKISKITLTPTVPNTNTKPTITHIQPSQIALNPLNKILSPKVTQISSPKLITMVVDGNNTVSNQNQTHVQTPNENRNSTVRNVSILPLGSNFRAKLQNIHNERTTAKQ